MQRSWKHLPGGRPTGTARPPGPAAPEHNATSTGSAPLRGSAPPAPPGAAGSHSRVRIPGTAPASPTSVSGPPRSGPAETTLRGGRGGATPAAGLRMRTCGGRHGAVGLPEQVPAAHGARAPGVPPAGEPAGPPHGPPGGRRGGAEHAGRRAVLSGLPPPPPAAEGAGGGSPGQTSQPRRRFLPASPRAGPAGGQVDAAGPLTPGASVRRRRASRQRSPGRCFSIRYAAQSGGERVVAGVCVSVKLS